MQIDPAAQAAFGSAIREIRMQRGISQEALAHACGLDRTYLSSVERGVRNLTLASILRIAAALEVDPAELHTRAGAALAASSPAQRS
jgi:transcriptional regulator with XRE-family HTH domain